MEKSLNCTVDDAKAVGTKLKTATCGVNIPELQLIKPALLGLPPVGATAKENLAELGPVHGQSVGEPNRLSETLALVT